MQIPRVWELLLGKASIDPEFREELVGQRSRLADRHGLPITAEERAMLEAVSEAQLRTFIAHTRVPENRRQGLASGCLVAALAAMLTAIAIPNLRKAGGHQPDSPVVCRTNMLALMGVLELYGMDHHVDPASLPSEILTDLPGKLMELKYLKNQDCFFCPGCREPYLFLHGLPHCKLHGRP